MSYFVFIYLVLPLLSFAEYQTGFYPLNLSMINPNSKTNDFSTDLNYCSCDLTANACDYACCCDTDCPNVKNLIYFLFTSKFIQSLAQTWYDQNQPECINSGNISF